MKRPVGRPRILASPDEALQRGMDYFAECDKNEEPYLISGLALALGFCDRHQMGEYEARKEYTHVIKMLRGIVEADYERRTDVKSIFIMKNMGWHDRQTTEVTGVNGGPVKLDATFEIVLRRPDDKPANCDDITKQNE